jgi:simple sugar transport system permease protein
VTRSLRLLLQDLVWFAGILAVGLMALALVLRMVGASPVDTARALWDGAFGSAYSTSETLVQTAPLLLTGLGVAVAFRCQLFNIGAEGQFLLGAIAATWVGTRHGILPIFYLPLALAAGAAAGALWAGIAAVLKNYRGVPVVLSTLLLNFIAQQMLAWVVRGPLQEPRGFPESNPIAIPARFTLLLPHTRLHSGVLLALFCAVAVWFYLRWTFGGFALRVVGAGEGAAEAAGINVRRTVLTALLISGALSGLAGAVQLTGVTYLLADNYSPGYGYTAIAVALLANLSPLGVVPSALFFGALTAGANVVQQRIPGVPAVVVQVLQAVVLFSVLACGWASRQRRRARGEGTPSRGSAAAAQAHPDARDVGAPA